MVERGFQLLFVVLISLSLTLPFAALAEKRNAAHPQQSSARSSVQSSQQPGDRGWPHGYSLPSEAQVIMYQPQVASWEGQKHLVALSAFSFIAKDQQKPALGTVKIEADTSVSLERSLVKFTSLRFSETNFPTLSKEQAREIVAELEKSIPDEDRIIDLNRVLVQRDKSQIAPKNVASSVIALRELKAQGDPVILGLTTEAAARVPEAIVVEVSPGAGVVSEQEAAADAKGRKGHPKG